MESNIQAFLKVLDSNDNTTGGGTASSIAGSMAAGLTAMVARLSIGKILPELDKRYELITEQATCLSKELFDGGRKDCEAFAMVSAAYKLPKNSEQEKKKRGDMIQEKMIHAANVPLENAQKCLTVIDLAKQLKEKYNTNASSDLECAVNLAHAGLMGCVANVRINIPYIKNESICNKINTHLEKVLQRLSTDS